jgi:PAS domain S-box-containing protein
LSLDPARVQKPDDDNSAKTLHAILEASPLAIIAFQPDWTVHLWNRAAETLYGWARHETITRRLPMLRAQDDETFRDLLRRALDAPHGIADVPAVHRRRDGQTIQAHISLAPLRAPDGRLRGFLAIVTDVSERVRLAEELRQAQRMEVVGRLAGGIAHDFNNLLTVISAHAHFLTSDLPPGDALVDDAQAIQEASERAASLTRQLLLFARKQVPQRRVVDLNTKLANVDRILRRTLGSHIEFVTIPSTSSACVDGDPGQMEQVIMNLILNARDAMPDGGALVAELSVDGAWDDALPRTATITVSDTGTGMDEATRSRIFEPFFTTKGADRGTGLGLATVYGIVTDMGGSIDVESAPGLGSTFRVRLPLTTRGKEAQSEARDERSLLGAETVLVVEDEDAVRAVAARVLRAYGYTVLTARHGNDALAVLRESNRVDLLVTDLVMPAMPGQELAARARALAPRIRVLFMSGYSELPQRRGAMGPSAPVVRKPFAADALARAVREVLDEG